MSILTPLIIIFCILNSAFLFAQDSLRFISSTTGAASYEVEYFNNYLYTGAGTTLQVYDVTPPNAPPFGLVYEYHFRSLIVEMKIHNGYLYIAANHDGISKWDISTPSLPQKICEYIPTDLNETAYDISFYDDSLLLSTNSKMILFEDMGGSFQKISEFAYPSGNGHFIGSDVKDTLLAFVQQRGSTGDGVYLYNIKTLTQISYFPQTFCEPEDVIFGVNNNLLHVLGGTASWTNPFDPRGLFYSLDISAPSSPQEIFRDTIPGFPGLAIAAPMNAVNINDTIYVATQAGLEPGYVFPNPAYGHVYVYDATDTSSIYRDTALIAGLWHFDVTTDTKRLFIASEWYGVKTLDIANLPFYTDIGNTLTGGWNMGADKWGGYLVLANEGYGIRKWDISDIGNPVPVLLNNDGGFCYNVKFSNDGDYVYALYATMDGFRIYDADSLTLAGSINAGMNSGFGYSHGSRIYQWNDQLYMNMNPNNQEALKIVNVSNPASPFLDTSITMQINDMFMDENGKLFIVNNDSLFVMDVSSGNLTRLTAIPMTGIFDAKKIIAYKDTLYAFVNWKGLVRYLLNFDGFNYSLVEDTNISLANGVPDFMAADSFGIYIAWTQYGLYAFSKTTLQNISYYQTGLDYRNAPGNWPVEDLFCKDGYIFLVEYFAQTSILTMGDMITGDKNVFPYETETPHVSLLVYPNPGSGKITVHSPVLKDQCCELKIYNAFGQEVFVSYISGHTSEISLDFPYGIYYIQIISGESTEVKKLKIIR